MTPSGTGATDGAALDGATAPDGQSSTVEGTSRGPVTGPGASDVTALRLEVDRLTDLLINENVGLSVGILMVRRNCGSREALATLVGAAMDAGRSMIEQADLIVAHYDGRSGHPVSQGYRRPARAAISAT